jgi:hypothetical protein
MMKKKLLILACKMKCSAFLKWANKGKRNRTFEFHKVDLVVAEALNRCAFEGDLETARSLAKAYIT